MLGLFVNEMEKSCSSSRADVEALQGSIRPSVVLDRLCPCVVDPSQVAVIGVCTFDMHVVLTVAKAGSSACVCGSFIWGAQGASASC